MRRIESRDATVKMGSCFIRCSPCQIRARLPAGRISPSSLPLALLGGRLGAPALACTLTEPLPLLGGHLLAAPARAAQGSGAVAPAEPVAAEENPAQRQKPD